MALSGLPKGVVPWSNIWKTVTKHRLLLVGFPGLVRDPIHLKMWELRLLVIRLEAGTCGFRRVSEPEFAELTCQRKEDIDAGIIKPRPPRKKRSDDGGVRGRHLNPETRTKTRRRGKIPSSQPFIREEEDDIESDDSEWEQMFEQVAVDSDPIEDWSGSE